MKRRYTRERALENIKRIRELMPGVMLTADLMVGFPGESEEDFLETLSFVSEAGLLDAHVFAYSKREGTPAAEYGGQIAESVKHERSARLIAEVKRVRDSVLDGVVARGEMLPTVLETADSDGFFGHSDSYIEVLLEGSDGKQGDLVFVKPLYHKDGVIHGVIAENNN